jgi:hypothetical protein
LALIVLTAGAAHASGGWELLGDRKVDRSLDRDEIKVTAREGRFRQIQLRVHDAAVVFHDVRVHFGDGTVQDVEVRTRIPAGGTTRAIDLDGGKRVIEKVVFWYNTPPARRKRATVRLYGRE